MKKKKRSKLKYAASSKKKTFQGTKKQLRNDPPKETQISSKSDCQNLRSACLNPGKKVLMKLLRKKPHFHIYEHFCGNTKVRITPNKITPSKRFYLKRLCDSG